MTSAGSGIQVHESRTRRRHNGDCLEATGRQIELTDLALAQRHKLRLCGSAALRKGVRRFRSLKESRCAEGRRLRRDLNLPWFLKESSTTHEHHPHHPWHCDPENKYVPSLTPLQKDFDFGDGSGAGTTDSPFSRDSKSVLYHRYRK